jgi:hypothetical protein
MVRREPIVQMIKYEAKAAIKPVPNTISDTEHRNRNTSNRQDVTEGT